MAFASTPAKMKIIRSSTRFPSTFGALSHQNAVALARSVFCSARVTARGRGCHTLSHSSSRTFELAKPKVQQTLSTATRRLFVQMASGAAPIPQDELQSRQKTLHALNSVQINLNLLPSGIAVPPALAEGLDCASVEFLNEVAGAAQKLAFSGLFSSIVAGPTNESDEYVDVPVYLGEPASNVVVDTNWIKAQLVSDAQIPIKVRRSPSSVQVNSHELEIFSGLDSSLKEDSPFRRVSELLSELCPGSVHIFELGAELKNGGKTACCLFGNRTGHWLGLVSCRVAT